jgi:hypothetical protein
MESDSACTTTVTQQAGFLPPTEHFLQEKILYVKIICEGARERISVL